MIIMSGCTSRPFFVFEYYQELFFAATLASGQDPAAVKVGPTVNQMCGGMIAVPAPENIINTIDKPAHAQDL